MINSITSSGPRAANIVLGQNCAKKAEPAQVASVETTGTGKPAQAANRRGHVPPGLARAAENIAAKIFSRADADGNGMVTQEELGAVHSRHARMLAASDVFQAPTELATTSAVETPSESTDPVVEGAGVESVATQPATTAPTQPGVTEAQLKAALAKYFYAKVGVAWTPPAPPAAQPTSTTPASPAVTEDETAPETPVADPAFSAVA